MDYLEWNNAIGERFFNQERSGIRVFLFVTKEVVTEIGASHDADFNDFVAAVRTGPSWNTRHGRGICQQALQAMEDWRGRGLVYPPYLNYLALFVVAGIIDVGFARHSYYPGLRSVLGEIPDAGMYPSFNQMYHLWDDLAAWSNQDKHGEWGVFNADIVGEWMHVGLPKAQTLLTDEERVNLPLLFADSGLDPCSPPSDNELAVLLSEDRHHILLTHTKELLKSGRAADSALRMALIETLLDELGDWDGLFIARSDGGETTQSSFGNLHLSMMLDLTAQTARFYLRCRSNSDLPEEGLLLSGGGIQNPIYCREDCRGWSLPLSNSEGQDNVFDASCFDWRDGLSLAGSEQAWKTTFSKRPVRVMIRASLLGFDGFIEQSQLPQGKAFYLLAYDEHAEVIQSWGRTYCEEFSEIAQISGLPARWRLYSVGRAKSDRLIGDDFQYLAFPTVLRIHFLGGHRVKGNQYMSFALPQIDVTGAVEYSGVLCNGRPLDRDPETSLYMIPDALCARTLVIEVKRDNECLCRKILYVLETVAWLEVARTAGIDRFGRRASDGATEKCIGPIVEGVIPPDFNPGIFLPPSAGHKIFFIGRNPGEIVECPDNGLPDSWRPVWAVSMHGRGRGIVVYCGTNLVDEVPGTINCSDHRRQRLWKDILWYKRMQITNPSLPALRTLWRLYREAAEHAR